MQSLLDIGTGGGFPLLPLALSLPHVRCVGLDATAKKLDAVQRIVDMLGMTNVELLTGRTESLAHRGDLRASFDVVTARAVAPLAVLLEYGAPFLRVGGLLACWKSVTFADELASSAVAQKELRCPYVGTFTYTLPETWGDRAILFFRKNGETPADYPRRTGVPKQKPL